MKRLLPLFLAILLSFPVYNTWAQTLSVINAAKKSVVLVGWNVEEEKIFSCTGIQVGIIWVLTAEHCLPPKDSPNEMYVNGKVSKIIKRDDAFALLETLPGERPFLSLRKDNIKTGETVIIFGYAWGGPLLAFRRMIANTPDVHLILDGPIAQGMSGGPIIDVEGRLVGLNQAGNNVIGMACGREEIKKFIEGK